MNPDRHEFQTGDVDAGPAAAPQPLDATPPPATTVLSVPWARPVQVADAGGLAFSPSGSGAGLPSAAALPDTDPMLLNRMGRLAAIADVGLLILAWLAAEVLVGAALALLVDIPITESGEPDLVAIKPLIIPMMSIRAIVMGALILIVLRLRRQPAPAAGLTLRRLTLNVLLGLSCCSFLYGMLLALAMMVMFLVPGFEEDMSRNQQQLRAMLPDAGPLGLLFLAVVVGFHEELVFRGFIMPRLRRWLGSWIPAVLISTGVFTALHALDQVTAALPLICMLSLAFSALTIWRRSIVPAIVAHALFDFVQFGLMYAAAGASS